MAEVLGIVASGINVASLVGSILKVGFKTSELLKEVQQYPAEIAHRLQDLQLLAMSIGQSEKAQHALPSQPALDHARIQCQRCLNELQLALEEFSAQISKARGLKRSITIAKVVLKRDTLDRIERRLKHAFDTLMLAHQVYLMHVVQAEGQNVQGYLTKVIERYYREQNRRSMWPRNPLEDSIINRQHIRTYGVRASSFGNTSSAKLLVVGIAALTGMTEIEVQHRRQDRDVMKADVNAEPTEDSFELILRLAPPHWVSFYLMEFSLGLRHSSSGIGCYINFRPRNVEFDDADRYFDFLSKCIRSGDILAMSKQLEGRARLLLDDDDRGASLVYTAMHSFQWSMCNLLLDRGVVLHTWKVESFWEKFPEFSFDRDNYIEDTLHGSMERWWCPDQKCHGDNVVQLLKFMRHNDQEDDLIASLFKHYEGTIASFNGVRSSIWPDEEYYDATFSTKRMRVAISLAHGARLTPNKTAEMIRVSLCPQGNLSEVQLDLSITDNSGNNLLHCLAGTIGHLEGRQSTQEWCALIRDIVARAFNKELALQLPGRSHGPYFETPLLQLIQRNLTSKLEGNNTPSEAGQHWCQNAIRHWLEALHAGGVDLASYGREERLFMSQYSSKLDFILCTRSWIVFRLISFEFGSSPSQWKFYWSQVTDEFVGQFWKLVESGLDISPVSQANVPGSWPDEESDFEET